MKSLVARFDAWLDDRTGYHDFIREALYESVPGGARWRYVWGSTLVFTFTVQVITGLFLWMAYSPSAQTAWESVFYIQHEMQGGWLLRGIHHFTAQAMIVLLVLHLMQVVIDGAYRAPREVNFWLGLVLMQIVLALSLTGYLLPWDQKGFWATRVATELMGLVPVVGEYLQRVVVGGPEYGHHTLTRFFALHAGLLPGLLIFFLVLHVYMFRRHGLCHKEPLRGPEATFWPDQLLKDAVACLAVLAVILFLVIRPALSTQGLDLQQGHLGAELGAPADPSEQYSAARPEWYFLFLFQFLKLFPGKYEVVGALVIPGIVMLLLFLMPILGQWRLGHRFNIVFLLLIICGAAALTGMAWYDDHYRGEGSKDYLRAVEVADQDALRAIQLASGPENIPATGAVTLLRNDPKTQGRRLFEKNCAICHGKRPEQAGNNDQQPAASGAPDLLGSGLLAEAAAGGRFATYKWVRGLLDHTKIDTPAYFGNTKHAHADGMVDFVKGDLKEWTPAERDAVAWALSSEAQLGSQAHEEQRRKKEILAGQDLLKNDERGCAQCHKFHDATGGDAPDLTGYGSEPWLTQFISNPEHERFYGSKNDRMPQFGAKGILRPIDIQLIVRFLREDWYEPAGVRASQPHGVAAR